MTENSNVLRVLAVDDDLVSLRILSCKLQQCGYKVTATTKPTEALTILNEDKDGFDIVLTDIMMPDMDGFKLLEIIRKTNIPVIMISADSNTKTVVKGIKSGAHDYLEKPVQVEDLKKIIPEYVTKKPQSSEKCNEDETTKIYETESDQNGSPRKKMKIETESDQNCSPQKKRRTIWTPYLHSKFLKAIKQIEASNESDSRVIPTKILQIMNVPGLTRENVASHLQKYRKGLIKKSESNGDDNNEQDLVSSPELSHATENCLHRNGQYEPSGFGSGSVNNSNLIFTYSPNQSYVFPPGNMPPQNYFQSSQMYPNLISSPMTPNSYGSQTLKLERTNDIPFNNPYQIPYFGSTQMPNNSSFASIHPNQFGLPLSEITPYTQSPNEFTSDFQMHRGLPNHQRVVQPPQVFSSFQQVPRSLQGQHDAQNGSSSMKENPNAAGENYGFSNITCGGMNSFNGNEQPYRTEHTQQHTNVQAVDCQNSFSLDDEIRSILCQGGQDVPIA